MKVLLTSPDALIDHSTDDFFPGIIESFDKLLEEKLVSAIAVASSHPEKLEKIPDRFNPLRVGFKDKQGRDFINRLIELNPQVITAHSDLMVLGANDGDFRMSVNSKLLLFRAIFARGNNPNSRVFEYGVPIDSPKHLYDFFDRFMAINPSCYYELQVADDTKLYSIISSNYYYEGNTNLKKLKKNITEFLKHQIARKDDLFLNYFLMSAYNKIGKLREIDFWGVYPSSTAGDYNEYVLQLKEEARKLYKCRTKEEILVRTKNSPKRTYMDKSDRLIDACDSQLSTIKVNPYYRGKIEGKTVCILDDFTTNGSSCETARTLLKEAGAARIIFITMGKFGRDYYKYAYRLNGDVFDSFTFKKPLGLMRVEGTFYEESNTELMKVLGDTVL